MKTSGELDPEVVNARAKRILRILRADRLHRALRKLHLVKDQLAARQALGLSYWLGPPARFPDLVEEIPLYFLAEQDFPGIN